MLPPPALRGTFRADARARAAYSEGAGIYRILPQAVARPADPGDLKKLIEWAAANKVALIPRGAGSAMGGGNVGDGLIVDLTGLPKQLLVDPSSRTAVTSCGVTLQDLQAAAALHGLRLPPDPSSSRWATLGGMVSTNAAGARSVRYGSVRRWVRALSLLTREGELVRLRRGISSKIDRHTEQTLQTAAPLIRSRFPETRKNSSGYALDEYLASGDVIDLIIGAEGTLGIVTEIEWELDEVPRYRGGMRVQLPSLRPLSEVVTALRGYEPSAVELLDRSFLDLLGEQRLTEAGLGAGIEALLLVEFERKDAEDLRSVISDAVRGVRSWALSVETAYTSAEAERLWNTRHAASPILANLGESRRSLQVIEDACVPLGRVSEYIEAVRRLAGDIEVPVVMFGHAGDGHIHVNLLPDIQKPGWETKLVTLLNEVTTKVIQLGGTPSGEHGDGRLRAGMLLNVYGAEIMELFQKVKDSFDPLGIFNPGIILPSGEPPISRLKVGSGAVPIPSDIEKALREIELRGGYERNRLELAGQEVEGQGSRV
jgi:FAD/FMN-containing dehydrogenase